MNFEQERANEELKEQVKHHAVLQDIQAVLATKSGKNFIKYLFENLEVCELPPLGLSGDLLMDKLGCLRAGNAILKIVMEANPDVTGSILAQMERERHVQERT